MRRNGKILNRNANILLMTIIIIQTLIVLSNQANVFNKNDKSPHNISATNRKNY